MEKKLTLAELKALELEEYEEETNSEDEAIQEAFAKGIIKPGLNVLTDEKPKTNNVPLLREKLRDLESNNIHLDWVERLDVTSKQAPMAPELSLQLQEEEKGHDRLVYDELKRESVFYRQAQDAVISVLPKLKQLGLVTERPSDYFAEMAKSDVHMQKVKAAAIRKKLMMERIEKLRQIRAQKKLQKALHSQAKVAKVESKKQILEEVKKYRKGETKSLSFLEPGHKSGKPQSSGKANRAQMKKKYKDTKFGFGGKKRGLKKNTRASTDGTETRKSGLSRAAPSRARKSGKAKRPGKSVRQKIKSKKR